jgi:hypothetical protein
MDKESLAEIQTRKRIQKEIEGIEKERSVHIQIKNGFTTN